jgi:eukaryotic-like serine/threonine-protein kinase
VEDDQSKTQTARQPGPEASSITSIDLMPGDRVGRHTVLEPIGAGSFGQVFLAFDEHLKRKVALKVLTRSRQGTHVRRFQREGEALAALAHPNVVSVFDVIDHPRGVVLAMEFVEGQTLTQWVVGRHWREVLQAFLQAARGLSAAHGAGMVHRDFKPDNVLVGGDGRIRVADFGLAARSDETAPPNEGHSSAFDTRVSVEGQVVGSPYFIAPEVKDGAERASASSDQYSFFRSLGLLLEHRKRGVGDDDVPPWVDAMIARGTAAPAERFADLAAIVKELEARLGLNVELDPYRGLKVRRLTFLAILAAVNLFYGFSWWRGEQTSGNRWMPLAVGLSSLAVLAGVVFYGRRNLAQSLTGRRTVALIGISLIGFVGNRALGVFWGSPLHQTATIDTLIVSVIALAGSMFVHRWMLSAAGFGFTALVLCAAWPEASRQLFVATVSFTLVQGFWRLRRPDQDRPGYLSNS